MAAFNEIRSGLSNNLRTSPKVAGGPAGQGRRHGTSPLPSSRGLSDDDLALEATVRMLRLLFLLFADGRGLRPVASRYSIFGEEPTRTLSDLRTPGANLKEASRLLGGMASGRRSGRPGNTCTDMDVRGLGDVYEAILKYTARAAGSGEQGLSTRRVSTRKSTGRYYTPESVVDYVVRKALGRRLRGLSSSEILSIKVLDPAMGSGHFLLRAADYLADAYGRALTREAARRSREDGRAIDRCRNMVINRCVYGVDTDPVAVEVARLSLWLLAGGGPKTMQALKRHLRCGDALLGAAFGDDVSGQRTGPTKRGGGWSGSNAPSRLRPFHWRLEFPGAARGRRRNGDAGFDVVLGNPPYVSFSGRQKACGVGGASGSGARQPRSKGWPSAHGLFILRATELICDHGIVAFITPGQVGHLRGYGPVRAELLRACDLLEVRYWGEDVFRGVTTPALTFVARGRGVRRHSTCVLKREDGGTDRFSPGGEDPWFVSPDRHMLERMTGLHTSIETFCDPGVHTGNAAAKLLLSSPKPRWVPLIEGKQVHPFQCDPPARWLNLRYKPSGDEYFRISDAGVYRDADILIRQTASRPVAARHSHRCHFRNSVLALKAPEGFSVEYLLGVLNSAAADILYRAVAPESGQRAFPQIKVHALRRLPFPDPRLGRNRPAVARIESVVKSIEARTREGKSTSSLMRTLNALVLNLYGLSGVGE